MNARISRIRRLVGLTESSATCAQCGEKWPCSDSKRKDISGIERAKHHVMPDVSEYLDDLKKDYNDLVSAIEAGDTSASGKFMSAVKRLQADLDAIQRHAKK